MCFTTDDFKIGSKDILLGTIDDTPVYIAKSHFALWENSALILDVTEGRGSSFSLEAPEGIRFISRAEILEEPNKQ